MVLKGKISDHQRFVLSYGLQEIMTPKIIETASYYSSALATNSNLRKKQQQVTTKWWQSNGGHVSPQRQSPKSYPIHNICYEQQLNSSPSRASPDGNGKGSPSMLINNYAGARLQKSGWMDLEGPQNLVEIFLFVGEDLKF
ncbi:hypothetical protein CHUAL_006170 [Chamberlinius hualienensis]